MSYSAVVLGIDAAWTTREPSGVALVGKVDGQWRTLAVAPSYAAFAELANGGGVPWAGRSKGSDPDPSTMVQAATSIAGNRRPDLVVADIPLARTQIEARREADRAVSRAFGGAWCSTHSPNKECPGRISDELRNGFQELGYVLTTNHRTITGAQLLETYPHPALLKLMDAEQRLPYKVRKSARYWKGLPPTQRAERLHAIFSEILLALETKVQNASDFLPPKHELCSLASLKRYEDVIDALVCCWVGIEYLNGRAVPYGDETAAIWLP